jgi:hypothetical protein
LINSRRSIRESKAVSGAFSERNVWDGFDTQQHTLDDAPVSKIPVVRLFPISCLSVLSN